MLRASCSSLQQASHKAPYRNVHTLEEYGACHPELVPHKRFPAVSDRAWADQPVAAIALIEMSRDWHQDLQLCLDLLRQARRWLSRS